MIGCVDVSKTYQLGERRVEALRGVNLNIEGPGYFGIMGASGSGKSTLLHLLAGLDVPDSGEVHVGGRRIDGMNERELTLFRRHGIGIVFQQFNLIPTMNARENVELPGMLAGRERAALRDRSDVLLEALGMAGRAEHRPQALSGGEQQRVAIARALFFAPPVLLADEPTGNLDSASSEALWALLGEIAAAQEMTVIIVTHEPAAAVHCQEVYTLHDGVVMGCISTDGLDAGGIATEQERFIRSA